MNKAMAATELEKSLEAGIGENIQELKRAGSALHHSENVDGEMSSNNLGILLGRVTERSTCEIENLIHELHSLRKRLETERDRIKSDIERHSELSHGVMQLTTIIADNVKRLPNPT